MNRLQKKCLIVSASCHGLPLLVLLVGPAFFISRDKVEPGHLLTMIPPGAISDAESRGGTPNIQEPPPAAPNLPPPVEPPKNDPPKAVEPVRLPSPPKPLDRPKPQTSQDFTPVKPQKPAPVKPQPDEFTMVNHPIKPPKTNPNSSANKTPTDTKAPQTRDNNQNIADALGKIKSIGQTLSPGAKIEPTSQGGDSDAQVSNYADIVYSKYYYAWTPPASTLKDTGLVTVRVTIGRNGRVTHSEIVSRSGDAAMDRSIQNTLDNVTIIEPFPSNSKDLERTFTIEFDLAAKRSL
jgi:TonB family protein